MVVLGFVSVKFIFKQLGEDALGIIYFTNLINITLNSALQNSIASTTIREVSSYYQSEPEYIRQMVQTSSSLYWLTYISISLAIVIFAPWIVDNWINLKSMDRDTAVLILRILGPASLVAVPKTLYYSLLRGLEDMGVTNAIEVATTFLQQFGIILILYVGGGLMPVVYWYTGIYLLRLILYIAYSGPHFGWLAFRPGYFQSVFKRNYRYTSRLVFAAVVETINAQIDKWVISTFMPIAQVGYYGFVFSGFSRARLFTGAVSQAAFPAFSALHNDGKWDKLVEQYNKMHDIVCYSAVPIFAFLIFAFIPLFSFVFDAQIAQELFWPGMLLCIGIYLQATMTVPHIFTLAIGNSGITAKQKVYDILIVPPAAIACIYYWGLVGAAFSFVLLNLLHMVYGLRRTIRECLKTTMWKWYSSFFKVLALTLVGYGIPWFVVTRLGNPSLLRLLFGYIIGSIGFFTGGYFLIHEDTRVSVHSFLRLLYNKAGLLRVRPRS